MGYFSIFMFLTILIMALFFLLNHSAQIFNLQFGTFLKVHQQKKEGLQLHSLMYLSLYLWLLRILARKIFQFRHKMRSHVIIKAVLRQHDRAYFGVAQVLKQLKFEWLHTPDRRCRRSSTTRDLLQQSRKTGKKIDPILPDFRMSSNFMTAHKLGRISSEVSFYDFKCKTIRIRFQALKCCLALFFSSKPKKSWNTMQFQVLLLC